MTSLLITLTGIQPEPYADQPVTLVADLDDQDAVALLDLAGGTDDRVLAVPARRADLEYGHLQPPFTWLIRVGQIVSITPASPLEGASDGRR